MNLLQQKIAKASQQYYTDGTSDLSDKEFDEMLDQLKKEDPTNPIITAVGHGYDVYADTTPGEKVPHRYGNAGSLDKCHNWKELDNDLKSANMWASLKLDGMSIVLYYESGNLVQALTRGSGDGEVGIDITAKARRILKTDAYDDTRLDDSQFTGAVRGEILMSYKNFELFQALHPQAENPRNSTVGLINGQSITDDYDYLDIVVYSVVGYSEDCCDICEYSKAQEWLAYNFSNVVDSCDLGYLDEIDFMNRMEILQSQWYGVYPADGIVLTQNELVPITNQDKHQTYLKHIANAFKFKAESAITKVIGVEWNLSKTKYLIPRIQFATVRLSGTNVSWCAGNNAKYIADNGIGKGAEIEVLKSGEIIPYLEKVHKSAVPSIPSNCPCCSSPLVRNGVHLQCPNLNCADADVQDTLVWIENISPYDGLGDTLKLKFLSDLMGDSISVDEIYGRDFPPFSPTKLVKERDFQRMFSRLFTNKVKLATALKALNVPRVGDVTSKKLAQYPETVMALVLAAENPNVPLNVEGFDKKIGEANMKSILDNLYKFKRLRYIHHNIDWTPEACVEGKKVAITGKLSVKRNVFEEELKAAGFIPGSIGKDTAFLITDDPNSSSSKNKYADEHGIQKITEAEFRVNYM